MDAIIKEKKKQLDELNNQNQELSREKSLNQGTIEEKKRSLNHLRTSIEEQQASWANIHSRYPDWPEDAEQLAMIQRQINEEAEKAGQALSDYNTLVKAIDRLRKEKEKAEKTLRDYNEQSDKDIQNAESKKNAANTTLTTEKGKTDNLNVQAQEKAQALTKANEALLSAKKEVESKTAALKAEIGDNDPDTYEQGLQKAKDDANKAVEFRDKRQQQSRQKSSKLIYSHTWSLSFKPGLTITMHPPTIHSRWPFPTSSISVSPRPTGKLFVRS